VAATESARQLANAGTDQQGADADTEGCCRPADLQLFGFQLFGGVGGDCLGHRLGEFAG
jgi:hypothetical protein